MWTDAIRCGDGRDGISRLHGRAALLESRLQAAPSADSGRVSNPSIQT
jgi:hypothetical protein